MFRLATIFTLVAFALYANSAAALWSVYAVASDAITAEYCINRTDPCCHGRCHMTAETDHEERDAVPTAASSALKLEPMLAAAPDSWPAPAAPATFGSPASSATLAGIHRLPDHPPPHLA